MADLSTRTADEASAFSNVRCTKCGAARLKRKDGSPGVCSLIGCPSPLFDVDIERGLAPCSECKGQGWHIGECHPREVCGVCNGLGVAPSVRVSDGEVSK